MSIGPGSRVGPYEVTALLGEGGMGNVWRARHAGLKRDDALKVLPEAFGADEERLARFQREAQILASLNHPNIAHVYGLEDAGGARALIMELVEGPTLAELIGRGGSSEGPPPRTPAWWGGDPPAGESKDSPLPMDDALAIAMQIASALDAAHERGVVHRDLKPANVKVRLDGVVKVLDFGLAKAIEPMAALTDATASPTITTPAMTRAGVILGTAAYMAPEQARGKQVDKRADVWAFGCVLYEMLTGRRAFEGADVADTLGAVLKVEPDWAKLPSGTPATIRRLLSRCLAKDPRARQRDMGDILVVVAVEIDGRRLGRIRLRRIPDASSASLLAFVQDVVEPGSRMHTDGWLGYEPLRRHGYKHRVTFLPGHAKTPSQLMPHVHQVVSLLKRWLLGTHTGRPRTNISTTTSMSSRFGSIAADQAVFPLGAAGGRGRPGPVRVAGPIRSHALVRRTTRSGALSRLLE